MKIYRNFNIEKKFKHSAIAMGSEEIAIRSILPQEIDTYDPFDGEVKVWQT